jgi:Zn-dependent peptidase ImmA (M78 family)
LTQLAAKMELDLRTVSAYESGEKSPSRASFARLARALDFPEAFFTGDDLEELSPDGVSFRSMSRMTARLRDMAIAQGTFAIELMGWLERRFELPKPNLPDLRHETSTPEAAADSLRRYWGIGEMPILNMVHLMEANGIRVCSLAVDAREVDAFSMWHGSQPIAMLNGFKSAEHSRFDAAHELGHLVLHRHVAASGNKLAEAQADTFASALLMPRAHLLAHMPKFVTVDELVRLKSLWRVSVSALNYRLHKIRRTTDWQYKAMCIEISKRGYRSHEPNECSRESSIILPGLFASLHREDGLSRAAIANELRLPVWELNSLLFGLTISALEGRRKKETLPSGGRAELTIVK